MKFKSLLFFCLSFSFVGNSLLAQICNVQITYPANDTAICQGDSIYLRSEGNCNIFMNNDFENGLGNGWASANANPVFITNGCGDEYFPFGPGPAGTYCWVGVNGAYPRSITTEIFNISAGDCWVRFWMRWGRAIHSGYSDCEDPNEPDEGLHLQYSIDFGANWIDFPGVDQYAEGINSSLPPFITNVPGSGGYWTPTEHNPVGGMHDPVRYDTSSVYWWHRYSCHVPLAAITNGTMFRFLQDFNQAAGSDTWGLDEVQIYCHSDPDVIWSHGPTVFNPANPVSPSVTTDYIVMVYDSVGNFDRDTVTITVIPVPDPDLGPDTIVCDDGINTAYFDAGPGYDEYIWNTGETTQVITPSTTGWYTVTAINNGMCSGTDSVYLQMIPMAVADAGSDEIICEDYSFDFSTSGSPPSASNFSSLLWYGGTGTFSNPNALHPVYTPGPGELGYITLTLVGYGMAPCYNDTSRMTLLIIDSPEADFTFAPSDSICVNEPILFSGSSSTNIVNWDWDFDDGNTGTGPMVLHSFSTAGLYNVSLIVTNDSSCLDTVIHQVQVHELPQATITVLPDTAICAEEPLTFLGSSTTNIIHWNWYFGDGNNASGQNVTYTYTIPGTYNVKLFVENENSCLDTAFQRVVVHSLPTVDFSISPNDTSCVGEILSFNGTGSADITIWQWDFGDGNTAIGQNVTHSYTTGGTYTIMLVVSNANGCIDTAIHQRVVVDVTVDFTMNPDPSCEGFTVDFAGIGNVSFTDWIWDFGDGNTDTGKYVSHNYPNPGSYPVSLTVCSEVVLDTLTVNPRVFSDAGSDEEICEGYVFDFSTATTPATASNYSSVLWSGGLGTFNDATLLHPVYTPAAAELGYVTLMMVAYGIAPCYNDTSYMTLLIIDSPEADFTFAPSDSICVNEPILFNGSSSTNIVDWSWDFDDGNTGNGPMVLHSFSIAGLYDVSLIVTNDSNCVDTVIRQVQVHELPQATITVLPDTAICAEETFTFNGSGTTNIISWNWYFGDGNNASGQNVTHAYNTPGIYTVVLLVENDNSCLDTAHQQVLVHALPTTDFTISPNDTSCVGEIINFSGFGSADITTWNWYFGDGNTAMGQNVTHAYIAGGTYNVMLVVSNANGCLDTAIHQRVVVDVTIDFTMAPDPSCEGYLVTFNGIGDASFTDWLWDFGDGNTAIGKNVAHIYPVANTYTVTLDVCSESVSYPLIVNPQAAADAGSDERVCEGYSFDFSSSGIPASASDYSSLFWYGGTGTFSDPTLLHPVYTPGAGELGYITLTLVAYGIAPCYNDTSRMTLLVVDSPEGDFTYNPADSICVNEPVLFNGSSSTNIVDWSWDFDDGNTGTGPMVLHSFSIAGLYDVSLIVTNDSNCVDTVIHQVQVHELPQATITVLPDTAICAGETLTFNGSSTTSIISWSWDFGDGNTSLGQNASHTYTIPGYYTVALFVENDNTCLDTAYQQVLIHALPTTDFTISPNDTSCVGEIISFDGVGSADITMWQWDFGDGNTAIGQNVTHSYIAGGTYNIMLVVSNANGCLDTAIHQRVVVDVTIDFTMAPDPSCEGYLVTFNGIGDASFTDWLWDFGDGNTAIGKNVTHIYTIANTYTVTLEVCSESVSYPLMVNPAAMADAGSDEFTCEEVPFDLSNSSTMPSASGYSSIFWYGGSGMFNDPTTITPVYSPAIGETGPVILTLVSYGFAPCENDTSQMTLMVVPRAVASAGSDEASCRGKPFDFATSSVIPSALYFDTLYWTGGAGYFIDPGAEVPVYVPDPAELGPVTLTLHASGMITDCDSVDQMVLTIYPDYFTSIDTTICFTDSIFLQGSWQSASGLYIDTMPSVNNCDSVVHTNLTVRPEIDYDFIADPISVCQGEPFYFFQSGSSTITDFIWDFGDGQTSTLFNPSHIYSYPGNYNVTLSYTDDEGCSDQKVHPVGVYLSADVDFDVSPTLTCTNDLITFTGYSTFNIVQWEWDFGDGQTGLGQNVTHNYSSPGYYTITLVGTTFTGCDDTAAHTVYISSPPVAAFDYEILICDSVHFIDESYHPLGHDIISWEWDFDDGYSSTQQSPWHVYEHSGIYQVMLITTSDSAGVVCSDTLVQPVNVPVGPSVYFSWDAEPTCFGNPTSFYGTSGSDIISWHWNFDDGNTSAEQNPVHNYASTDSFNVVLTVTDSQGCDESETHTIHVVDIPGVDFTVIPNPTCRYSLTNFDASSPTAINTWHWDFGDGGLGFGQHTNHIYNLPGTYDVLITVNDSVGCSNTTTHPVIVNDIPTADFSFSDYNCTNDLVYFTDESYSSNGNIIQWNWDFGDGTDTTIYLPDDPDIGHQYDEPGPYTVTLTVIDSVNCSHSFSRVLEIASSPIADFNNPPACDSIPVYFTDLSSINSGPPIVYWDWNFGDTASPSNTSIQQDPAHIFSESGTYLVTLVATNITGCSDTIVKPVVVHDIPDVDFTMISDTVCIFDEVFFTGLSPMALTYWWEFGDGGTSVEMNPVYVYENTGTYLVTLTVTDEHGCTNSVSHTIVVDPLPWAAFNHSMPACTGVPVSFEDESSPTTGYLEQWHWYFGDGTDTIIYYPDDPDVTHMYGNAGLYSVSLVISSSGGCVDSTGNDVYISQGPLASFAHSENDCAGEIIEFYDLSLSFGGSIVSWQWDFGDPSSGIANYSNLQNPTHVYDSAGTYLVSLEVVMAGGCYNTGYQEVVIEPKPPVDFYTNPPITCFSNITYFFTDPDVTNLQEISSYLWDFGDPGSGMNNLSAVQNPVHLYASPGVYNVTLTITDVNNCHNTIGHQVVVGEKPVAIFAFNTPCLNDTTRFIDGSLGIGAPIASWLWDFNDPSSAPHDTSTLQNPSHLFSEAGVYNVQLLVSDSNGCFDAIEKVVQINNPPNSAFEFNHSCDGPGTVIFTDKSLPAAANLPIVDWLWELAPGVHSNQVNPVHQYPHVDSCYQVSLMVTDLNGCRKESAQQVCIMGPLNLTLTGTEACLGEPTFFSANCIPHNDSIKEWIWNFSDGSALVTTTHDTVSHLFNEQGDYLVKVSAVNFDGCEYSTHTEVVVHSLPLPEFTATIASCNEPTCFTDLSVAPGSAISEWEWAFGDGEYGNQQNPVHTYGPQDSTYNVKLTVTSAAGCKDSIQKSVYKGPCLIAAFEANIPAPCINLAACFSDGSVLYSNEHPIARWDWDFGDGNTEFYFEYRDTVCHLYQQAGSYEVELKVTSIIDDVLQQDSAYRNIHFAQSPSSDFSFDKACAGHDTKFTDNSSGHGTAVTSWAWDFGDIYATNDTSSLRYPSYAYSFPGTYHARLITTNNYGCSDTAIKAIEVFSSPLADFTNSFSCAGQFTSFTEEAVSAGAGIWKWSWDFGDGISESDTSNLQNPVYVYETDGHYTVQLKVIDENFCEDVIRKGVDVMPSPKSDFSVICNYRGVAGQVFCDNLSSGATQYMWDFDNGKTSELENPKVLYEEQGKYLIQLVAVNEQQCYDTSYREVDIIIQGLYVPTAFVPGGDNPKLKTFKPVGVNLRKYKIEIYNRWGSMIWSSMKLDEEGRPAEEWDGTYKGKPVPVGNYVWIIEAEFKTGQTWEGSNVGDGNERNFGTVTIIR